MYVVLRLLLTSQRKLLMPDFVVSFNVVSSTSFDSLSLVPSLCLYLYFSSGHTEHIPYGTLIQRNTVSGKIRNKFDEIFFYCPFLHSIYLAQMDFTFFF